MWGYGCSSRSQAFLPADVSEEEEGEEEQAGEDHDSHGRTGTYDYAYYSPALVYYENLANGQPRYVAEAASHEAGHNLSLSHDATGSSSYYSGHGSGAVSWGPLMGTGYNRNVSQWSRGEHSDASNTQDDTGIPRSKVKY